MNDRSLSVLEQYELKVLNTRRGRGAILCDTDCGLKLLKQLSTSPKRIEIQGKLLSKIKEAGYKNVDLLVKNKESEYISCDRDETPYILKDWFDGKECDVKNEQEILAATRNLAKLHKVMVLEELDEEEKKLYTSEDLIHEYERHNRELKKVRTYIRNKRRKSEFELKFMEYFYFFFEQGEEALNNLRGSEYSRLREECLEKGLICHGDYNHHNVIMLKKDMATTNYERSSIGLQISDLYQFMRKIMEKHSWNVTLGRTMLDNYRSIRPISNEELYHLKIRLSYPEKFWKLANHYYNSNKAWIPGKNIEKLKILGKQGKLRDSFLKSLFP